MAQEHLPGRAEDDPRSERERPHRYVEPPRMSLAAIAARNAS